MNFSQKCKHSLWPVGILLAVLCFLLGAAEEQFAVIFKKAVMICLECIGIG